MSLYDKAKQTADFIKSKINNIPKTAIVLGSGLGPFAKEIEEEVEFDYKDIPNFPSSLSRFSLPFFIVSSIICSLSSFLILLFAP